MRVYCRIVLASLCIATCLIPTAGTQEYRAEVLDEAPPTDELSKEIGPLLSRKGFKVIRGESRTVCEIWFCQTWEIKADFEPTHELLYPFQPGQLIGVARYSRRGSDFRDQDIDRGVYTLRYDLQPVDGNHEGTSPTRDFLLLVKAEQDSSAKPIEPEKLSELSAEAAGTTHPAMLCLQSGKSGGESRPTMRHDEDKDWWIAQIVGKGKTKENARDVPIDVVVAGFGPE